MSTAAVALPRVIHAVPGRMRVHLPGWLGAGPRDIEVRLRQLHGVRSAQANPVTGNVLIRFDPATTDDRAILGAVHTLETDTTGGRKYAAPPPALHERNGAIGRARIAVRGLDRDPDLARRVEETLECRPSVRARANVLTGRVLVQFDERLTALEELIADVAGLELLPLPGEDRPSHPLDPGPLIRSGSRIIGALLGLGLLGARQVAGLQGPPVSGPGPAETAAVIGILEGFPVVRSGLGALIGRSTVDLLFGAAGIVTLTLSGAPLGLTVVGLRALRVWTDVRARQAAFLRYEEHLGEAAIAIPGSVVRLEAGARTPLAAHVVEGHGMAIERDGLPVPLNPGSTTTAGACLQGGPFVLELYGDAPFVPQSRPAPIAPSLYDHYVRTADLGSLGYALVLGLITRSFAHGFIGLLLVNPRTAIIGSEAADRGASARVLRAGTVVVGTRPERPVRLPQVLLVDGPRVVTEGLEIGGVVPLAAGYEQSDVLARATAVAVAAGVTWSGAFRSTGRTPARQGSCDGLRATAYLNGVRYVLEPLGVPTAPPTARAADWPGDYLLVLRCDREVQPLGLVALRPKLAPGVDELVHACRQHGVELALLDAGAPATAEAVARRAGVPVVVRDAALDVIRARQATGALVAFVSDSAHAMPAFAACDLAIGYSSGYSGPFPARADLLAPDLGALAAIIEVGARRALAVRAAVALSLSANIAGAVWGFRGVPGIMRASYVTYAAALATLAFGWVRLRGGQPALTIAARLADPRPERWGCRSTADVLSVLRTTEAGLTSAEAAKRKPPRVQTVRRRTFLDEIVGQLRSPVTAILAAGAGLSFTLGAFADVAMIGMVIFGNAAIGAWQERKAGEVTEALERIGAATARVLRAGNVALVPADDVVPGDVLLLAPGDRVAADARLLEAHGLEVDEAALTGESLPVAKQPDGDTDWSRVVLEGSGVTVGTGRAVVVAVGQHTRLGATAAALALDETQQSPLGVRLSQMLHQMLPVIALGGAVAIAAGMFWQGDWATSLAVGASIAITAIPEGLPLLAGIGEAGVARRLAGRRALVRRLAAVEALGRVDVACTDKTGTLTQGRLTLSLVSDTQQEHGPSSGLPPVLCHVLLTAALASPHPNALDAGAHPTDVAIVQGATDAGLRPALDTEHAAESRFDSARPFHAALVDGRLCVKGAAEALVPRCTWLRSGGASRPLDERDQQELLATAEQLAQRGLRVLMVAEGAPDTLPDDPQELVALGFVGLSDPLRPGVQAAVGRCREAGVRVVMLTGDHPATARVIAEQVGLLGPDDEVITGAEIAELHNGELDERLEHAAVIARITPLDKLRIVESLQRRGHTVAMTGDGVNDAPALRLADVGVAMGQGGTEVARHAADVVLVDDDFATLVDMFVEGRGFWRNMRRALGLLVGSNLGELGFMVGALALGAGAPLTSRQILAVNLVNDGPALAVVLQQPEHRNLSSLAREGTAALGRPLRNDILRRATATAVPALSGYLLALRFGGAAQARSVAFGTIVATQLAQTLDLGRSGAGFTGSVLGAVAGSAGLLVTALTLPLVRDFLVLATPDVLGWTLIGSAALVAVPLARVLATAHGRGTGC